MQKKRKLLKELLREAKYKVNVSDSAKEKIDKSIVSLLTDKNYKSELDRFENGRFKLIKTKVQDIFMYSFLSDSKYKIYPGKREEMFAMVSQDLRTLIEIDRGNILWIKQKGDKQEWYGLRVDLNGYDWTGSREKDEHIWYLYIPEIKKLIFVVM